MAFERPAKASTPVSGEEHCDAGSIEHWIEIVRGEYLQIPGLLLTRDQVRRFWGLDAAVCDQVLEALVETRFLERTEGDRFARPGSTASGPEGARDPPPARTPSS